MAGVVPSWPDAVMLAALTAGVWALLAASAARIVAEARPRPKRSGPSRPRALKDAPSSLRRGH